MTSSQQPTTEDLYPDGRGYHKAHGPYIAAVAAALDAAGFPVADWYADPNDPRDGGIQLDLERQGTIDGKPLWGGHDEVWVGWQEERGWTLLTVDKFDEPQWNKGWQTDSRYVHDLMGDMPRPRSVVLAVAEHVGLSLDLSSVDLPGDGFPEEDFSGHEFERENVALELALRRYTTAVSPMGSDRSFKDLLADEHEQFDRRGEVLASIVEYAAASGSAASAAPEATNSVTLDQRALVEALNVAEARGYARAVEALRDDRRYVAYYSAGPTAVPPVDTRRSIRNHFADYLEVVAPEGGACDA